MRKRTAAAVISLLCSVIIVLGVISWNEYGRAAGYERYLDANHQHAFGELVTSMKLIDATLKKAQVVTSPSMAGALCTELYGEAMTAQMSMGALPFSSTGLEHTMKFISLVGDYSFSLSKKAAGGMVFSEEERENLKKLSETADLLSSNLVGLQTGMNDGALEMDKIVDRVSRTDVDELADTLGMSMKSYELEFPEIPTLIYDGPFSEHLISMEPKYLDGREEVSEEEAKKIAAQFIGISENKLSFAGKSAGAIPCYYFNANGEGGAISASLTVAGGKMVNIINSRNVELTSLGPEEALVIARRYLEVRGYPDMTESYYMVANNKITVNFAYSQDGVICYSDLIKLTLALDNGAMTCFEAKGYVMAHEKRQLPEVLVPEEAAREKVLPELTVLSHGMALIPTDGLYEVLCHEFKCEAENGANYIVYVNAETGEQQKILILLEDENGTLTM